MGRIAVGFTTDGWDIEWMPVPDSLMDMETWNKIKHALVDALSIRLKDIDDLKRIGGEETLQVALDNINAN